METKCKCCEGKGIQRKLDGINIICPCCNGDGEDRNINRNIKFPPGKPYIPLVGPNTLIC